MLEPLREKGYRRDNKGVGSLFLTRLSVSPRAPGRRAGTQLARRFWRYPMLLQSLLVFSSRG